MDDDLRGYLGRLFRTKTCSPLSVISMLRCFCIREVKQLVCQKFRMIRKEGGQSVLLVREKEVRTFGQEVRRMRSANLMRKSERNEVSLDF
jgi:hypothetical protein